MKTIFKLLVAALCVNASVRGGRAAWDYYEFKDATTQLLTFGDRTPPSAIRGRIIDKATELELPLLDDDVSVRREGVHTTAEASYTQVLELFPNYPYPFTFSFAVDSYSLAPGVQEQ